MTILRAGGLRLPDRELPKLALLVSIILHAALAVTIVLGGALSLKPPRVEPRSIDLVSLKDLLPPPVIAPAAPAPPRPAAPAAPAAAPAAAAAPSPAQAASPDPASDPAPEGGPALAEDLSPAGAGSGGMSVPTGTGGTGSGPPAPIAPAAPAAPAAPVAGQPSGEPDYLPQFRITDFPVLPAKTILSKIQYPPLAARQGIEATVFLELFIDDTGKIRKITVLKDPGHGFAEAALAALRGLTCSPAMVDGQAVAVRFRYPVRFTLR